MRRDLMEAVLGAASEALFAPAMWSGNPAASVNVYQGGGDVDFTIFGDSARRATHWFRGIKAELPGLDEGQTLTVEGVVYVVLDKRTPMDAPLEWDIAARAIA